jgi:NADP-reducing hydrogenase subunit HndB
MSAKISSPEELRKLRERARADVEVRGDPKETSITVHMGTCGIAAGARDVMSALMAELGQAGVATVTLRQSGCIGLCDQEPMLTLKESTGREYLYVRLDKNKARRIVAEHVVGGKPAADLVAAGQEGAKA